MRIAVTGGTGYLGSRLAGNLRDLGHDVRILSRSNGYDITRKAALKDAFRSCNVVFHLAALVQSRPDNKFREINVRSLQNVFEECEASQVERTIYLSSFTVFGPSRNVPHNETSLPIRYSFFHDYDRTKYEGLQVAREWKQRIPLDIVYPGVIYGPGPLTEGNILTYLLRRWYCTRLAALPAMGRPVWNFVFIDDVVEGLVLHLSRGAGEDFVLGGDNRDLRELAETFRKVSGRRMLILPIPQTLFLLSS